MKKTLLILLSLFYASLSSQKIVIDSSIQILDSLKYNLIDSENNIFGFSSDNKKLKKKNELKEFNYQNIIMGEIENISVTNPKKTIVFFKKFNGVEILNENLKRMDFLDFNNNPKIKVEKIAGSEFNNIWIYSKESNKIIYYDIKNREQIFETETLLEIFGMPFEPQKVISSLNRVWLLSKRGVIEINNLGHISNIFRYTNIEFVFPFNEYVGFVTKHKIVLKKYDDVKEIENIFKNYNQMFFYDKRFFVVYDKKIDICEIVLEVH